MNKGLFRLVFSKHLGMFVPASEAARCHTCKASGSRARQRRRALAAALFALSLNHAYAVDPVALPTGGAIASGSGSIATVGSAMTVNQITNKMIVNWNSFNIGSGASVNFVQPGRMASVLNRIGGTDPSQIYGSLTANGNVYLVNGNGIVFGDGAQVSVGSLTASSLDVTDDLFNAGVLSNPAAASFAGSGGFVRVEQGAAITAATGGRVMLLAPEVENSGVITTPDGQTILAAGKKVYLSDSEDPAGLLVEVDAGGSATNLGEIVAQRGNVTLMGLAVNQQGRISASTSVRANGSIHLLARDSVNVTTSNGVTTHTPQRYGSVTLGAGSTTVVSAEVDDQEEVLDQQAFTPSRVNIEGRNVTVDGLIEAKGGDVSVNAKLDLEDAPPHTEASFQDLQNRIYLGENAKIDVSGVDATAPMSRHQLEIQLFSEQLKDAPLLRGGALFGKKIYVDARKGTPLTDIAPFMALKGRTVAEKLSTGGTVRLDASSASTAPGDVVVRDGAVVDVSGGSITYEQGLIKESSLRYNGKLIPIAEATPDKIYQGTGETYSTTDQKWGVTRSWTLASSPDGTLQQGYRDASDAGSITISAANAALDGTFRSSTSSGAMQRETPADGGTFNLALNNSIRLVQEALKLPGDFAAAEALPPAQSGEAQLDTGLLRAGFSHLDVSGGGIIVDAPVNIAPAGSLKLSGDTTINADITLPGGDITINGGNVLIADGVTLSTAGLWSNDAPGIAAALTAPVMLDGGSVNITGTVSGANALTLGTGSLIDASAGAWLTADGKLKGGKGGNITLNGVIGLGAHQVQSYGFSQGGALTLGTLQDVQIGGQPPVAGTAFWLAESFFGQGGFSRYAISASAPDADMRLGDGGGSATIIHPQIQNLQTQSGYATRASGIAMDKVAAPVLLASHLRAPASLSFSAGDDLTVFANTTLRTDAPADSSAQAGAIALAAGGQLTIDGTLIAPAGSISAAITGTSANFDYDNTQSLFVGDTAKLLATGIYAVQPSSNGRLDAEVLDGGSIVLDGGQRGVVATREGSLLDVSGTAGEADIAIAQGYTRQTLHGAAGSISISSRNGLALDGELRGRATGTGAGGTLALSMTGSAESKEGNDHPNGTRVLTVTQDKINRAGGLQAGAALDGVVDAGADPESLDDDIGTGAISVEQIADGGFDRVSLKADLGAAGDKIVLPSGVNLDVPTALTLDAGLLEVTGDGTARIAAANVTLTTSATTQAAPVAGDGRLEVAANFIDLVNAVGVSGVASTLLDSATDIRGRGANYGITGSLTTPGELVLRARQIYPVSNGRFLFQATGADSRIDVQSSGAAPVPVLSAGGKLTMKADHIEQGGALLAPLGEITLDAAQTLTLKDGSLTSVSADGQLIPFGVTRLGGIDLVQPTSDLLPSDNVDGMSALPDKRVTLKSAEIDLQSGATVDISGGGDTLAYEWIEGIGGSSDILGQQGVYAVIPSMQGEVAAFDYNYENGSDLRLGDAVYLAGVPGLAAGTYTLLPGRYALLPGAFMVQASSAEVASGSTVRQVDGASLVSGYRTTLDGSSRDSEFSTFRVTDGSIFRPASGTISKAPAEYLLTTGNQFFRDQALAAGLDVPRLASDAGQVALNAATRLTLNADLLTGKAAGARGALVDIVSDKISVVSAVGADDGTLQLTADALNALDAESLLLGGTRAQGSDGLTLTTSSSTVTFANDSQHALSVTELIAAAKDTLTVSTGAAIDTGQTSQAAGSTLLHASGDGALLAVSALNDLEFDRSGVSNTLGTLNIETGASVGAQRSMVLDATRTATLAGTAAVEQGGSVTLGANRILLGDAGNVTGMKVDDNLVASLGALSKVTFNSYNNIDIYGPVEFGNGNLDVTLNAGAIAGHMGANESASLTARNLVLKNSTGAAYEPTAMAAGSTLNVHADSIRLQGKNPETSGLPANAGKTTIAGFANINLQTDGEIVFSGSGTSTVDATQTTLTSARITADTGTDYTLSASGSLATAKTASPAALAAADDLGAKLTLAGAGVTVGGNVELPSGQFTAQATQGNLTLADDAHVQAGSAAVRFDRYTAYTPGGSVTLQSDLGNVAVNSGAVVDVSGGSGGGDAGTVKIIATKGSASVAGTLHGQAVDGRRAGSFVLDANTLPSFSDLNTVLNSGGFTAARDMRVRSGDVAIAAGDTVNAQNFVLSADAGKVDVYGTVDARGANGGNIEIYAKNDLTLQAGGRLLADATANSTAKGDGVGDGGSVLLSSDSGQVQAVVFEADGVTRRTDAAQIDVSGDQAGPVHGEAGQVTLRAGRTGTDNAAFNPVTTTGTATAYTASGVTLARGVVVAFKPHLNNSGTTPTLNGKTLKKNGGDALAAADLKVGKTYLAVYDGTNFQLVSGDSNGSFAVGTGVNVAFDAPAAVTGAGEVRLEAVRSYEKTTLDAKAQLQLAADTQAFYSKAGSVLVNYQTTQDGTAPTLTPGVEVRSSSGDLTVSSDWNMDTSSNGSLAMAGAGALTLRAKGNLAINGSLNDGFNAATPLANLVDGDSWSYRLAAGSDLVAVNPLSTTRSTTSGNLTLANGKLIRSGTGDIDIATGGNLTMGNDSSVIYSAGRAADTVTGFVAPELSSLGNKNGMTSASYLTDGGDIDIRVQGDITGKIGASGQQQTIGQWLFRQGGGSGGKDVSWWVRPDLFKQGVAAFGGGDVAVRADGNITNFSVSIPTTARYTDDGSGNFSVDGGGNLWVSAGGDIKSGLYYAGRGDIRLDAGGEIGAVSNSFGTTLALQDASAEVSAVKNAFIETVFNPTLWAQASNVTNALGTTGDSAFFMTYGDDSAFHLSSLVGDVKLGLTKTSNITGKLAAGLNGSTTAASAALEVHPATVSATAFGGDILLGRLVLAPSATGNLNLLAAGNVSTSGSSLIAMSDADASLLPGVQNPLAGSANLGTAMTQLRNEHASTPVHQGDTQPVVIVARDGSISLIGDTGSSTAAGPGLQTPKAAYLRAGQDITLNADLQHVDAQDITVISAGNDFVMPLDASTQVKIGGPGELMITAGRNIDLGSTAGVSAVANTDNSALPGTGANLTLLAGLGDEEADVADYIATYIAPSGAGPAVLQDDGSKLAEYRQQTAQAVTAYMRQLTGNSSLADTDAMAQYLALDGDRQALFAYRHFSSELLASGKGFAESGNHERGDSAIATLFKGDAYDGDILMYKSQVRTLRDGSIDMLTPGGLINAGVPGDVGSLGHDIGIVTESGGDIRAFAESGFLVNQSKVITQYGGDVTVWVNNGDIDAGRGSKTAVSVPRREIATDADGNTSIKFKGVAAGSGIRAQTYDPDGPDGAGVAPELGSVALIAPRGVLNAGEAGIAAGNFLAVATQVIGADNIQVSGSSSGVPVADTGSLAGSLAGVSDVAADATKSATEEVARQVAQAAVSQFSAENFLPSFISVEVIGLGD